jgi:hypothetical protein
VCRSPAFLNVPSSTTYSGWVIPTPRVQYDGNANPGQSTSWGVSTPCYINSNNNCAPLPAGNLNMWMGSFGPVGNSTTAGPNPPDVYVYDHSSTLSERTGTNTPGGYSIGGPAGYLTTVNRGHYGNANCGIGPNFAYGCKSDSRGITIQRPVAWSKGVTDGNAYNDAAGAGVGQSVQVTTNLSAAFCFISGIATNWGAAANSAYIAPYSATDPNSAGRLYVTGPYTQAMATCVGYGSQ